MTIITDKNGGWTFQVIKMVESLILTSLSLLGLHCFCYQPWYSGHPKDSDLVQDPGEPEGHGGQARPRGHAQDERDRQKLQSSYGR